MISKLQQAGSCPAHRLWPGRQLEVLTGLGQERYPAHGLWPGLAIPTASGQGCSRLKAGVSDKKQSKKQFEIFELFVSKKIFKEYFRVLFLKKKIFRNILS